MEQFQISGLLRAYLRSCPARAVQQASSQLTVGQAQVTSLTISIPEPSTLEWESITVTGFNYPGYPDISQGPYTYYSGAIYVAMPIANITVRTEVRKWVIGDPTWTELADTAAPVTLSGENNQFNAVGSYIWFTSADHQDTVTADTWRYNPANDTWTTGYAPMPTPRGCLSAIGPDNRIYFPGGYNYQTVSTVDDTFESYDPGSDTWFSLAPLPVALAECAVEFGEDGYLYALGGYDGNDYVQHFFRYSIGGDLWETLTPPPNDLTSSRIPTCLGKRPDGKIALISPYDISLEDWLFTTYFYDPDLDSWANAGADYPSLFSGDSWRALRVGDDLYVPGNGTHIYKLAGS